MAAVVLLLGFASSAGAQNAHRSSDPAVTSAAATNADERRTAITIWSASASDQPVATRLGYRYDRGLYILGVRKEWMLRADDSRAAQLTYTMDLLPLVVSTRMRAFTVQDVPCPDKPLCVERRTDSTRQYTAYALGASPIGLAGRLAVTRQLGIQLHASGGAMYFSQAVPDPAACRLNFSADAGVALEARLGPDLALTAGMRFNHISNGGRSWANPGMNSRMTEVGLTLAR
jgi:hypothetical protein